MHALLHICYALRVFPIPSQENGEKKKKKRKTLLLFLLSCQCYIHHFSKSDKKNKNKKNKSQNDLNAFKLGFPLVTYFQHEGPHEKETHSVAVITEKECQFPLLPRTWP